MHVTAHPSLIYALGYGFLTGLTPCVFPMIPITLAIFGVKAGTPKSLATEGQRQQQRMNEHGEQQRKSESLVFTARASTRLQTATCDSRRWRRLPGGRRCPRGA